MLVGERACGGIGRRRGEGQSLSLVRIPWISLAMVVEEVEEEVKWWE